MLEALADPQNDRAWERFDRDYRPLLVEFALRLGLGADDAEEVAQRAAIAFFDGYQRGQYSRARGRLRNWLLGIARNKIADYYAEQAAHPTSPAERAGAEAKLSQIADPDSLSAVWDEQWQTHVLSLCLRHAREHFAERDIHIFELFAIEGKTTLEVADEVNLSREHVTTIKHRVLKYVKAVKARIEGMQ